MKYGTNYASPTVRIATDLFMLIFLSRQPLYLTQRTLNFNYDVVSLALPQMYRSAFVIQVCKRIHRFEYNRIEQHII